MKVNETDIVKTVYWSSRPGKFVDMHTGETTREPAENPAIFGTMAQWYDSLTHTVSSIGLQNRMVGKVKWLMSNHVWNMVLKHTSWGSESPNSNLEERELCSETATNTFYLIDTATNKTIKFVVLDMSII
jgi:hypothetical protein